MPRQYKDGLFHLGVRHRQFNERGRGSCAESQKRLKFLSAWKRPLQKLNYLCNALGAHGRVASRPAKSYQEADVSSDAVANCAKARQVDEETLFESGG